MRPPDRRSPSHRGSRPLGLALKLVLALTLAALGARLLAVRSMLPHQVEPDAVIYWQSAWLDRPDDYGEMSHWAYPASFYPILLAATLRALPGRSFTQVRPAERPVEEHLAAASRPFVRGRAFIALLSVLAIPGVYFLARSFLSTSASLLAAAFMATSLLDLLYGAQARPHTASASLSLLAMVALLRVHRSGSLPAYALAGLACGIAVGTLQNGVFVLPGLLLAHFLRRERRLARLVLALLLVGMLFAACYWNVVLGILALPKTPGVLELGGQTLKWEFFTGEGFGQILGAQWAYEPFMVAPAALGLLLLLVRILRGAPGETLRAMAVAASFPLAFVLWWGIQFLVHARFTVPLVPFVAILAAYGVERAARAAGSRPAILVGLALAVLAVPAWACARLSWLRARPDTHTLAARWLAANADREGDLVHVGFLTDLPLLQERAVLEVLPEHFQSHWQRYQMHLPAGAAVEAWSLRPLWSPAAWQDRRVRAEEVREMLAAGGPAFAVAVVPSEPARAADATWPTLREVCGAPVAAIHPYDPSRLEWYGSGYELGLHPLGKILHSTAWGPPIEIFRVPRL